MSNGVNLELQQYNKILAWKIVGTLKKSGDKMSPNYYLSNTGSQEANLAIQLEKAWSEKWVSDIYFSSFNAELGILRGSHIGNISDLEEALKRDEPFYTKDKFSYNYDSPYQRVNHQLFKFKNRYSINENQSLELVYAWQENLRKEFDVRRGGRSILPALSLDQTSNFLELKYKHYLAKEWTFSTGIQLNRIENINLPETGILPLIPDYISYEYGGFGVLAKSFEKTKIEFGFRSDQEDRRIATISSSVPRRIIRYENKYSNLSAMLGISQELIKGWSTSINLGIASRGPEVNELYSNGLHQGVSGIELGDPDLNIENSFKGTISLKGNLRKNWFLEGLFFYQSVEDYIYLQAQSEIALTIRGAFPVFKYEQTNAQLMGFDLASNYQVSEHINITSKYSFIEGRDLSNDIPLVFMPANNLSNGLLFQFPKFKKFQNISLEIKNRIVFRQSKLLASQDFVTAPDAYCLFDFSASTEKQYSKLNVRYYLSIDNLLNTEYRDYLNRQRYYADDMGINLRLGINLSF